MTRTNPETAVLLWTFSSLAQTPCIWAELDGVLHTGWVAAAILTPVLAVLPGVGAAFAVMGGVQGLDMPWGAAVALALPQIGVMAWARR